ncbi:MAG: tetratricopeptide repeat protein [Longimicrobiales bacterium]
MTGEERRDRKTGKKLQGDSPAAEGAARAGSSREAPAPAAGDPATPAALAEVDVSESEGRLHDAIDALRMLLLDDPGNTVLRLRVARLYQRTSEHMLALEQLEAGRDAEPENVDVLGELGAVLAGLGRFEAAERELRRALRLDPNRADVYSHLGIMLFRRGLYAQAEVELRRATELDSNAAAAHFYCGETLNQLGRVDDALGMLERAVALDPSNAKAFYTMGILYDKKNLRHQAETMYRKSREASVA